MTERILYIITKSNYGGAQKYVFELAREMQTRGYDVTVACGGTGSAGADTGELVTKLHDTHIPHRTITHFMRDMSLWRDVNAFFEIKKLIRELKPDVLHVTSSKAGGIGAFAGRVCGVRNIVFTSHGLTYDESWRPYWQRVAILLFTWLTIVLSHTSIMISSGSCKRTQKLWGAKRKVQLVYNGVIPVECITKDAARATLDPTGDNNSIWIGGVGELHPNKNWSLAIKAMESITNAHLYIIGEGQSRGELQALIDSHDLHDRVTLLGFIPAAQYLKAFDIFTLLSHKEGLPYVLLEAGQANRAVVASNIEGVHDIIKHNETGLLTDLEKGQVTQQFKRLIDDPNLRDQLGDALHTYVRETFSLERMYDATEKIYSSRIDKSGAR